MITFKRKAKPKRKRGTPSSKDTYFPQHIVQSNGQEAKYLVLMGCLGQFNVPLRINRDNDDGD
jgi:hypothetical protein